MIRGGYKYEQCQDLHTMGGGTPKEDSIALEDNFPRKRIETVAFKKERYETLPEHYTEKRC